MQELLFGFLIGVCIVNLIWGTALYFRNRKEHDESDTKECVISENDFYEQYIKFQQLERIYMETQNHCKVLGRAFCDLGFKGSSPEFCIGKMIENAILKANSQQEQRKADNYLKMYCGYSFEELVDKIRDN